jgi:inhibitor of nuclear factor kappa-B kinase subunit alpha
MEAKREKIVTLLHAQTPIPEIMKELGTSRRTITRVKKALEERGNVKHKAGAGRKPKVVTPRLINVLKARIWRNPIRSMRGMAKDLKVSEWTIRNVVKNKLGARSLARTKRFLLSDRLKASRLERSKKILHILKRNTPIILFSDEKYFTVDPVSNSRIDRFITKKRAKDVPDSIRSVQKAKHPAQVMMFGLVASDGKKMPPVFLESGFRMGAKEYLNRILITHVLPWIQENFSDSDNIVFMQDGVPCHTAKTVQKWLADNVKFWPKEVWPPSSPDLNPLDFSIWAYVQSKACAQQHPNIDSLKDAVAKEWNNMEEGFIRTVCSRFRPRIEAVIKADGGYID